MRLTEHEYAVLAAAAYLDGVTPTELASAHVADYLATAAKSERVARVVRERLEHEAERDGKLATLMSERGRRPGTGRAT